MTPQEIVAFADEFIQDLARGNVESYILDYINLSVKTNFDAQQYITLLSNLYSRMSEFQGATTPEQKHKAAVSVLSQVLQCRYHGVLKNNPNTVKALVAERDFYKSRTTAAEELAKDLQGKLQSAYGAVEKLMGDIEKMKLKGWTPEQ